MFGFDNASEDYSLNWVADGFSSKQRLLTYWQIGASLPNLSIISSTPDLTPVDAHPSPAMVGGSPGSSFHEPTISQTRGRHRMPYRPLGIVFANGSRARYFRADDGGL